MPMKKVLIFIFVLAIFLTALASCTEGGEDNSNQTSSTAVNSGDETAEESNTESSSEESTPPDIVYEDFGGREFIVLSIGTSDTISEILPSELTDDSRSWLTEAVNEAIEQRNRLTEEHLKVVIKEKMVESGRVGDKMLTYIRQEIAGSSHTFDVCTPSIYDCGTLAAEDIFINLKEIPSLNTENEWWDQSFNQSMTVNNCLYFTLGDIGIINKNATPVVYFNKKLAADLGIKASDLYELVKDYKWTFDKAYEYAKMLSIDMDDNGIINYKDKVGWAGQADDTWNFFFGSGERIVSPSSEGTLRLTFYNPRSTNVAEKMYDMFRDRTHYISANDFFGDANEPTYECTGKAFIEGRVLFFSDNMAFMHYFSAMDDDFGVLPTPKYDEDQDSYYSLINPWTGNAFAVPITLDEDNAYFAGAVLDVMGYYSVSTVAFEYEQRTLTYQKARDEESIDMLQLILNTRGCDFGIIYNIGSSSGSGIPWMLQQIMRDPAGTFASRYDAIEEAAQMDLEDVIAAYYGD